jgi:Zn-dependent protease
LLLSLFWFVIIDIVVLTPVATVWIVGVLALHELGHYLGMRFFGYRDVHMFFMPALGAAVSGQKPGVPAWQESIVLLLGPLPGLLLGCGIYFLDLAYAVPVLRTGAGWLVTLNFLNLLPFEPLDGGKLCNRHVFSRFRWLEAVMVAVGAAGLVLVCLHPNWYWLALSAGFALVFLAPARYKLSQVAAELQSRWPHLPPEWADLSEEQWYDFFLGAKRFVKMKQPFTQLKPDAVQIVVNNFALQMRAMQARALARPESTAATLVILAVYLSALALGMATASFTHLSEDMARWRLQTNASGQVQP